MRTSKELIAALLALLALSSRQDAGAHPHVWIETRATLRFDAERRLTALAAEWVFDDLYTGFALEDVEKGEDGGVSPEALQPLADQNVRELAEWGYFTLLKADGGRVELGPAQEQRMRYADGRLTLSFVLPLPEPINPREREIAFAIFDPTFYIDMLPARQQALRLEGAPPEGCTAQLRPEQQGDERYVPDSFALSVETDPAAPENSLGARVARWAELSCRKAS